jgi:hypothetical protein
MEVSVKRREDVIPVGAKRCSCCRRVKPMGQFWANKKSPTGKQSQCKTCKAALTTEQRQTPWYPKWLAEYRARPEVAERIKACDARRREKHYAVRNAHRKTPRGKVMNSRWMAMRRLKAAEAAGSERRVGIALAMIAACDAEIARMDRARDKGNVTEREMRRHA